MKNKYSKLRRAEILRDFYNNKFHMELGKCEAYRISRMVYSADRAMKAAEIFMSKKHKMGGLVVELKVNNL